MSTMPDPSQSLRQGARAERARYAAAWAESHAERGDYEYALKWLDLVRKSSGGLSPRQLEHRRLWRGRLEASRRA